MKTKEEYQVIRFNLYTITLKNVLAFGDITLTSQEEYLQNTVEIAVDMMVRYGNTNSTLHITVKEARLTKNEIEELSKSAKLYGLNITDNPTTESFIDSIRENIAYANDGEKLYWDGVLYKGESGQTLTLEEIKDAEYEEIVR